jgi:hypothetical protein
MTIKWNWGTKIFLAYTSFVLFMVFMVYMCSRQHYDLVSSDYYAKELKYQDIITATENTQGLSEKVIVMQKAEGVEVKLPAQEAPRHDGKIEFYRPDNARLDFTETFADVSVISADRSKFKPGMYKVKVSWMSAGKPYYDEQPLFVQ